MSTDNPLEQPSDDMLAKIKIIINEGIKQECEPLVQEAMKQIETKIRAVVMAKVAAMVDFDYDVMRDHRQLIIMVRDK